MSQIYKSASSSPLTVLTLSDDVNTKIYPSGNNIQLVGHVNEQNGGKFSTVVAGTNLTNINPMSSARWIVDPLGFNGTHTTITNAVASASPGDTILLLPGSSGFSYNESFSLTAGVNITGQVGDDLTPNVSITGTITMTGAGTSTISNVQLITPSTYFLVVSGSSASKIYLSNCYLNCLNFTGINYSNSNVNSSINFYECIGNLATTGIAYHSASGSGSLGYIDCRLLNTGGSTTASNTSACLVGIQCCQIDAIFSTSLTGTLAINNCVIQPFSAGVNAVCVTTTGSGNATITNSYFISGSSSVVSAGSGTTISIFSTAINSTNTNALSGAGTIHYAGLTFLNSSTNSCTTQVPFAQSNDCLVVVTPASYPYTCNPQDAIILASSSAAHTVNLEASPKTGIQHIIKDATLTAATNNITISGNGNNIDGSSTLVMVTNGETRTLVFNGTQWNII